MFAFYPGPKNKTKEDDLDLDRILDKENFVFYTVQPRNQWSETSWIPANTLREQQEVKRVAAENAAAMGAEVDAIALFNTDDVTRAPRVVDNRVVNGSFYGWL